MRADVKNIAYFYRVKTSESILDKIERFKERSEGYPVNSILNDIFGARMILTSEEIAEVMERLDDWQEQYGLKTGICEIKTAISVFISISKIRAISTIRGNCNCGTRRM